MKSVYYNQLLNGALGNCARNTIQTIVSANIEGLENNPKIEKLSETTNIYIEALGKRVYNFYAPEMEKAEASLYRCYISFKKLGDSLLYASSNEEVDLGQKIKKHLDSLGRSWNRLKRSQQSPFIHSILNEFSKAEYQSLAIQVGLTPKLNAMQESLSTYDDILIAKANERVDIKSVDSATSLRSRLVEDLVAVFDYVQGMAITTESPQWVLLVEQLYDRFQSENTKSNRNRTLQNTTNKSVFPPAPKAVEEEKTGSVV